LVTLPEAKLVLVDPVEQNLAVAKGTRQLWNLDIPHYQQLADLWAEDIGRRMPKWEEEFNKRPQNWHNDIHEFRLGHICYYMHAFLGIRYNDYQRLQQERGEKVYYSDPSDLFLNGVMDTRRGTCGNMALLVMVLARRLGWPVSLMNLWWHSMVRFDNGAHTVNLEASNIEHGFKTPTDQELCEERHLTPAMVASGSDLTFLRPRPLLGSFFCARARHHYDMKEGELALRDFQFALQLHPKSRLHLHYVRELEEIRRRNPNMSLDKAFVYTY
jgi:hypothetical protein